MKLDEYEKLGDQRKRRQARLKFINRATSFFKKIGLPFQIVPSYVPDPVGSFFEGCWIDAGVLYYCPARIQSVGELLHEAAHLALTPRHQRTLIKPGAIAFSPPLGPFEALGDAAVEAWDWAAAAVADIPSIAVFIKGFDGEGLSVWESFDAQLHPGFTLLRFLGMSSRWGVCDRWFVGDVTVPKTDRAIFDCMQQCTRKEQLGILAAYRTSLQGSEQAESVLMAIETEMARLQAEIANDLQIARRKILSASP